ncbi:hypothetical protein BDW68DRAFT_191754 [Aspergillus falconensis]
MPGLQDVPSELIAMIIDHVESDKALRFSQTKRSFHTVAMPLLNYTVVISNHQGLPYRAMLGRLQGVAAAIKSLTDLKALSGLEKLIVKGGGLARDNQRFRVHKWHVFSTPFLELNLTDNEPWGCEIDAFVAHPTLKRLSILGAHISCTDAPTLTKALAISKGLRRFTLKGDILGSATDDRELRMEPKSYIATLRHHKQTLEILDINFWSFQGSYPDPLYMRALSMLQKFTARVEELYSRMLYQLPLSDCLLPRGLQELVLWATLHGPAERIQEDVRKKIDHRPHCPPNLRSLILESETPVMQVDVRWRRFMNDGYWLLDC